MTVLFSVITLALQEEKLSIMGSNCDVKHTTLVQILLSVLQVKVTLREGIFKRAEGPRKYRYASCGSHHRRNASVCGHRTPQIPLAMAFWP